MSFAAIKNDCLSFVQRYLLTAHTLHLHTNNKHTQDTARHLCAVLRHSVLANIKRRQRNLPAIQTVRKKEIWKHIYIVCDYDKIMCARVRAQVINDGCICI